MARGQRGGEYVTTATGRNVYVTGLQRRTSASGRIYYERPNGTRVYAGEGGAAGRPVAPAPVARPALTQERIQAKVNAKLAPRLEEINRQKREEVALHSGQLVDANNRAIADSLREKNERIEEFRQRQIAVHQQNVAASNESMRAGARAIQAEALRNRDNRIVGARIRAGSAVAAILNQEQLRARAAAATPAAAPSAAPSGGRQHAAPASLATPDHSTANDGEMISRGSTRAPVSLGATATAMRARMEASRGRITPQEAYRLLVAGAFRRGDAERIVRRAMSGANIPASTAAAAGNVTTRQAPARVEASGHIAGAGTRLVNGKPALERYEQHAAMSLAREYFCAGRNWGALTMSSATVTPHSEDKGFDVTASFIDTVTRRPVSVTFRRNVWPPGSMNGGPGGHAYHAYFEIHDDGYQGKATASYMMRDADEMYDRMGIKQIKVTAALSVGGYAWAALGFNFANDYERQGKINDVVRTIQRGKAPVPRDQEAALRAKIDRECPDAIRLANYTHPGHGERVPVDREHPRGFKNELIGDKAAKEAMLGGMFHGVRNLDSNEIGYQLGKAYYTAQIAKFERGEMRSANDRRGSNARAGSRY